MTCGRSRCRRQFHHVAQGRGSWGARRCAIGRATSRQPRSSRRSWLKLSGIHERIEAAGARLLYLPAYSLDFNPIELAFAKLKAILRVKADRTIPNLWDAIKRAFTRFTPSECRNYLAAAGYDTYDPI